MWRFLIKTCDWDITPVRFYNRVCSGKHGILATQSCIKGTPNPLGTGLKIAALATKKPSLFNPMLHHDVQSLTQWNLPSS